VGEHTNDRDSPLANTSSSSRRRAPTYSQPTSVGRQSEAWLWPAVGNR